MVRGVFIQRNEAERMLLSDALSRYLREITTLKRGAKQEASHISVLMSSSLAKQSLASIGSRETSRYRDERLRWEIIRWKSQTD